MHNTAMLVPHLCEEVAMILMVAFAKLESGSSVFSVLVQSVPVCSLTIRLNERNSEMIDVNYHIYVKGILIGKYVLELFYFH